MPDLQPVDGGQAAGIGAGRARRASPPAMAREADARHRRRSERRTETSAARRRRVTSHPVRPRDGPPGARPRTVAPTGRSIQDMGAWPCDPDVVRRVPSGRRRHRRRDRRLRRRADPHSHRQPAGRGVRDLRAAHRRSPARASTSRSPTSPPTGRPEHTPAHPRVNVIGRRAGAQRPSAGAPQRPLRRGAGRRRLDGRSVRRRGARRPHLRPRRLRHEGGHRRRRLRRRGDPPGRHRRCPARSR